VGGGRQPLPFIPGTEAAVQADGRLWLAQGGGYGTVRDGFYAERAAVVREALVPIPHGVDPAQASALGVVGATAWRLAGDVAPVQAGEPVLVLGASGGVGSVLLQLLRARGARVWGQTGSADKAEVITRLGAERAVVAEASELPGAVAELRPSVVYDCLAGPFTAAAAEALQPHGRLVLYGASAGPEITLQAAAVYRKGVQILTYGGIGEPPERVRRAAEEALGALARGEFQVPVAQVLPLSEAAEAHRRILERKVTGKLLLRP
jgi:NADPH2:quinone reductase